MDVQDVHLTLPFVLPDQSGTPFEVSANALQHLPCLLRGARHEPAALFDRELDIGSVRLQIVAARGNTPELGCLGGWQFFLLFVFFFISPTVACRCNSWRADWLGVLQTELFND